MKPDDVGGVRVDVHSCGMAGVYEMWSEDRVRRALPALLDLWRAAESYNRSMHLDEMHDAQCEMTAALARLEKLKP